MIYISFENNCKTCGFLMSQVGIESYPVTVDDIVEAFEKQRSEISKAHNGHDHYITHEVSYDDQEIDEATGYLPE